MRWKLLAKWLNAGGRTTATSARTLAIVAETVVARGREVRVETKSKSANSSRRYRLDPRLERARRLQLAQSLERQRLPVSTCPEISGSTSSRQAKFSMNWLGNSTASQGTPLMPATLGKSTCVSMWCRPWPNSWNSVSTS